MRWMEMIRLRTPQGQDRLAALLLDSVSRFTAEPELVEARVYANASLKSDLALYLVWSSTPAQQRGSRAGLSIAQVLKNHGVVEHSVWTEAGGAVASEEFGLDT